MKKMWSLEYIDEEGDQVVKHVEATDLEMARLLDTMGESGTMGCAYDLSGPGVSSNNGKTQDTKLLK